MDPEIPIDLTMGNLGGGGTSGGLLGGLFNGGMQNGAPIAPDSSLLNQANGAGMLMPNAANSTTGGLAGLLGGNFDPAKLQQLLKNPAFMAALQMMMTGQAPSSMTAASTLAKQNPGGLNNLLGGLGGLGGMPQTGMT